MIPVLENYSLPSWKRYFANYDGKRGESKSIVNISVTYGSPMALLFFSNSMEELQEMLHELNQASLEVGLSMNLKKTKVMYNEFAEDVEEPTTIDSRSLHLPRSMHLHGFRFEGTWDQTSYHPRMASFRLSEYSLQKQTFWSFSNARFTISASYQQSPTDLRPGILRNNKP